MLSHLWMMLLLFLTESQQITEVTDYSDFSYLPTCLQRIMTETYWPAGLQGAVCTPWQCVCANEAIATSTVSDMIDNYCGTNSLYYSEGVAFITSFCGQIQDSLAPTTSFVFPTSAKGIQIRNYQSDWFQPLRHQIRASEHLGPKPVPQLRRVATVRQLLAPLRLSGEP